MQGTMGRDLSTAWAFATAAFSVSLRGPGAFMVAMFCSICSRVDMPLRTVMTPSREAAKRRASATGSSPASTKGAFTSSARLARVPPFTGSMMTTGFPCFRATSQQPRDWMPGSSQSA